MPRRVQHPRETIHRTVKGPRVLLSTTDVPSLITGEGVTRSHTLCSMPGELECVPGYADATSVGEQPRRFTWRELSKLNRPHNAHVAVRGKVRSGEINLMTGFGFTNPSPWSSLLDRCTTSAALSLAILAALSSFCLGQAAM